MKSSLVENSKSAQIIEATGFVGTSEYWIAVRKMVNAARSDTLCSEKVAKRNGRLCAARCRLELCLWLLLRRSNKITPLAVRRAVNLVVRAHENRLDGAAMSRIFK